MVKFSDQVVITTLAFQCGGAARKFEYFEERIKTPSSGFNEKLSDDEKTVFADISKLLMPALKKNIQLVEGLKLHFGEFSFVYQG